MSKVGAILITFFLGELGVHRFMTGKIGTGILWLLTCGCFGIGWLVDFIMVCCGKFNKKDGTPWITEE
ncbi:MAG: TM2 domain-containing protein [Mageeibacillus sp.]|jgi:TM2 domain-containing membrane protein YozV|nr:TM2 domain-containing protein [Mageeibacillus sp.]MCI1263633.1 TM2 domain-containing protein [Saccharofermentans sp.]MCI1769355.1 TM2 domain-containing protein [Mageeibacillus sp.]MCI2043645.1 TM2 domain-containing protein [Mageeibacillus sp.]